MLKVNLVKNSPQNSTLPENRQVYTSKVFHDFNSMYEQSQNQNCGKKQLKLNDSQSVNMSIEENVLKVDPTTINRKTSLKDNLDCKFKGSNDITVFR